MFIATRTPTFRHKVDVLVPVDGGFDPQSFHATFNVLPSDREAEHDIGTVAGSNSFLRAIVVSMDELVDDAGNSVPYSDQLRDQLLKLPYVRASLVKTYFAAVQKATEGN